MKVIRPTKNDLSRGYTNTHKGYDFKGLNLPDEVFAGSDGAIIERVDLYVNPWINSGTLTTRDYGNYIKIRHEEGTFELHAHLKKASSLPVGTKVKAGQIVARIGNTGNSTGPHLHSEYRTVGNINTEVEFIEPPLEHDCDALQDELIEMRASRDKWKQSHKELEEKYAKEVSEKNKDYERLQSTLKESNKQVLALQQDKQLQAEELEELENTKIKLENECEAYIEKITDQNLENAQLRNKNSELNIKIQQKLKDFSLWEILSSRW